MFSRRKSGKPLSTANSLGSKIFGVSWILFSSIFVVIGCWTAWSSYNQALWEEVPCELVKFKVKAKLVKDPPFQPVTEYQYAWKGKEYTGTKVFPSKDGVDEYEELGELEYRSQHNQIQSCYVNPDNPQEAALVNDGGKEVWFGVAFATFGMMFVLIGVGVVMSGSEKRSLSGQAGGKVEKLKSAGGYVVAFIFCGAFAAAGTAMLVSSLKERSRAKAVEGWAETSATVIWSRVVTNSDGEGTSYHPEVFYRYKYQGGNFRSNENIGSGGSSSGYDSKKAMIADYPKGKKITCYVNAEKPWQASLGKGGSNWFLVLLSLPFLLVGFVGLGFCIYSLITGKSPGKRRGQYQVLAEQVGIEEELEEEKNLKPKNSRLAAIAGLLFFALFWNGIVSVFVVQVISGWRSGNGEMFLTLFMIPFVLVGLGCIGSLIYKVFGFFAPAPKLALSPGYFVLGETTSVGWQVPSGEHRVSDFTITLVGEEEAKYKRGTDTASDTAIFYEEVLVSEKKLGFKNKGKVKWTLPVDGLVPSWQSDNNAIKWKLLVRAKVERSPDIKDDYDVTVLSPELKTDL